MVTNRKSQVTDQFKSNSITLGDYMTNFRADLPYTLIPFDQQ